MTTAQAIEQEPICQSCLPNFFTEFKYVMRATGRVVFCWIARSEDDANAAFEEVLGMHPEQAGGLNIHVHELGE